MMRRLLLVVALVLVGSQAFAQVTVFPATGTADPAQFTSPDGSVVVSGTVGAVGLATDDSDKGHFSFGTATVSGDCILGDYYLETDANLFSVCTSTNVWRTGSTLTSGTADPAGTCDIGQFYYETDQQDIFFCYATNEWAMIVSNTTPTDDAVLVANGTTYQNKVVPDCDDTTGKHLNYDTTTNAWTCGTSGDGAGGGVTLGTYECYDEFITGLATTGNLGNCSEGFVAFGTGTLAAQEGIAAHPGLLRMNSHTSNDNSGVAVAERTVTGTVTAGQFTGSGADWLFDVLLQFGSNSTAITTSALYVGLLSGLSNDPIANSDGIRIRWDSDLTDTTFVFTMCDDDAAGCSQAGDATDQKVVASTITPVAGTWYRFRIRRLTSGVGGNPTYYFRVNDETEKTFCASGCDDDISQLPNSTALVPVVAFLTRNTTGVISSDLDYMYLKLPIVGTRY